MSFKAIVFDLDDTLYPEIEYKQSGFRSLAKFLKDEKKTYRYLKNFDEVSMKPITDFTNLLVKKYRTHKPRISCYPDTLPILNKLRPFYKLGLLTNDKTGNQMKKIEALGIKHLFEAILVAKPPHLKPNPQPFKELFQRLKVKPQEVITIGDDLETDFSAPYHLGCYTVLINRPKRIKPLDKLFRRFVKMKIKSLFELETYLQSGNYK